jgi:hypothetical protein
MPERMLKFEHIQPVKKRVEAHLRTFPGVHAVGMGEKYVNGKPSGEPSIVVLVVEKKPLDQLKPEEVIPSEIEGIKTDVIQVPMPRLDMAGDPSNLTLTVAATRLSFTLTGAATPGGGLLVFVEFTVTPSANVRVASYETANWDTLSSIATNLATELTKVGPTGMTATAAGTTVTMAPPPTQTLSITNADKSAIDDHQYFDDWVRGGIQITPAPEPGQGNGTLGCIATTAATPDYPQGKVVGITNHHVVRPETPDPANLVATMNPGGQIALSLKNPANPIGTGSVVAVSIYDGTGNTVIDEAEYVTVASDTALPTVVNGLAAVVTGLGLGLTVTPSGSTLTITGAPIFAVVRGPLQSTDDFSAAVDRNSITYSGTVGGDDDGIYLDIFPGGSNPSFGVFVNPPKNSEGNAMATAVWQAFNALPSAVRGSVTMDQPTANVITLHNIEVVESRITHDIRIGQPDASFGSSCCHCCSHRIGRVMAVRFDLDVALIQLDPDTKYKPEIQDIDLVAGVTPPTASMTVFKRGRTTQRTTAAQAGTVRAVDVAGHVITTGVAATMRFYNNVFMVQSANNFPFSLPGDSGAAVTDAAHNVVGINWGHSGLIAFATPIDVIVAAFPALALNFAPAPAAGQDAHAVRVVPKPAAHMEALADPGTRAVPSMASAPIRDRLLEAEKEVIAMPAGRKYADLIRSHFNEGLKLVNSNKKVATAWHRNGGPELLQAIFRVIQLNDQRLPTELQGRPLSECLARIWQVMARYASPRFAADLEIHAPRLADMAGFSYNDVLSTLQSWSEER